MRYVEIPLRKDGTAFLAAYLLDPNIRHQQRKERPAMLICPGGAYLTLAAKEGEPVAARWLGMGYQAFVVHYKHYVAERAEGGRPPVLDEESRVPQQLVDLMRAMETVHHNAGEWGIDKDRIYCMGFSAGAHVVGSLAEGFDDTELLRRARARVEHAKPAGVVMGYPMISARPLCRPVEEVPEQMRATLPLIARGIFGTDAPTDEQMGAIDLVRHVRHDMPRVFAWHTAEDTVVDPGETLAFFRELQRVGVPCELHFYERGPHGTSLCDWSTAACEDDMVPQNAAWVEACRRWLDLDAG